MILVDNRVYPIEKALLRTNTVFISPWTGEVWARIDRKCGEWLPLRVPAQGEPYWPGPDTIPGSLYSDYDEYWDGVTRELPRVLLIREISLIEGLTRATISCHNGATNGDSNMTPDLLQEIAALRGKVAAGTATDQELRDALRKMREGRMTATAKAASKAKVVTNPDEALAAFLS